MEWSLGGKYNAMEGPKSECIWAKQIRVGGLKKKIQVCMGREIKHWVS